MAGDVKRHGFDPQVGKISWRRAWKPTPVFLSGESLGQRSLPSTELQRVRHDGSNAACTHLASKYQCFRFDYNFHLAFKSPHSDHSLVLQFCAHSAALKQVAESHPGEWKGKVVLLRT